MSPQNQNWFLADDFSGALEVGAVLKKSGKSVEVVFNTWRQNESNVTLGVSSETRNASSKEAAVGLTEVLKGAGEGHLLFKKIDSTLRGPVGIELKVMTKRYPDRPILFAPTNPDVGRSVKDGRLLVDGVPVSQTPFATDPTAPVDQDDICKLITETGGPDSVCISLDPGHLSKEELQSQMATGWERSKVIVADATSLEDLELLVETAKQISENFLPCGSAGLARAMDGVGLFSYLTAGSVSSSPNPGRVLIVVGSLHPQSRSQLNYIQEEFGVAIEYLSLEKPIETKGLIRQLQETGVLVLASAVPQKNKPIDSSEAHKNAEFISSITRDLYDSGLVDTLFVTGGETARTVIDNLDCQRLKLEDEIAPGVAVARMTDHKGNEATLIVKPGGFGSPDLLAQILSIYGNLSIINLN